jgi:hypothetical protein
MRQRKFKKSMVGARFDACKGKPKAKNLRTLTPYFSGVFSI